MVAELNQKQELHPATQDEFNTFRETVYNLITDTTN